MRIIKTRPPNFKAIAAVFPHVATAKGIFYCYGDAVYNPDGAKVTPSILEHERAHAARQSIVGVDEWWRCYLASMEFRFNEEVIGHRAEWAAVQMKCALKHLRDHSLTQIVNRLSGPLYGGIVGPGRARELITSQEWTPAALGLQRVVDLGDSAPTI